MIYKANYKHRDGTKCREAILISGKSIEAAGIKARAQFPGSRLPCIDGYQNTEHFLLKLDAEEGEQWAEAIRKL